MQININWEKNPAECSGQMINGGASLLGVNLCLPLRSLGHRGQVTDFVKLPNSYLKNGADNNILESGSWGNELIFVKCLE